MMDWSKSYTAQWRIFRVNRDTWADAELISDVDSVSVTRTADGSLIESASMEVTGEISTDYYRIVMTAQQGNEATRVEVATLLFDAQSGTHDHGGVVQSVHGYSVLLPASTTLLLKGQYAPCGVNGAEYAAELLRSAINAPVVVDGAGFTLNNNLVHELDSSVLDAAWTVVNAGNHCIQIDGHGTVHITPMPTAPALQLDSAASSLLMNGIGYTQDVSAIPNRYVVVIGDARTVAVNDSIDSRVSTANRGYYVDVIDESPQPINGETLNAYALRKLHEESIVTDERRYTREYADGVNVYSIVRASLNGLNGDYRVQSQSITCDYGVTVQEKAAREIDLWQ